MNIIKGYKCQLIIMSQFNEYIPVIWWLGNEQCKCKINIISEDYMEIAIISFMKKYDHLHYCYQIDNCSLLKTICSLFY